LTLSLKKLDSLKNLRSFSKDEMAPIPPPPPRPTTQSPHLTAWLEQFVSPEKIEGGVYRRRPYGHHKDRVKELEPYFQALASDVPHGGLSLIARITKVPIQTVSHWHGILSREPGWRPSRKAYGDAQRIFTDQEEWELVCRIQRRYLQPGLFLSDTVFRQEALRFRRDLVDRINARCPADARKDDQVYADRFRDLLEFKASQPFIAGFRRRHEISLRRPSFKRRPSVDADALNRFVERVREILVRYPPDRVINIDETNWKVVNGGFRTWAPRGREAVRCRTEDDEKAGVPAIGAIDAAGRKLPLTVIGKGKTRRCLAGYKWPDGVFQLTSISGWTTSDVMCSYLRHLRQDSYPEGPLVVILDTDSAHRTELVKATAAGLGIELEFVPPGCTDLLQPLDRRVFGVLKSSGRQQWTEHYLSTQGGKTTRAWMADSLVRAWNRISPGVIESAWSIDWQEEGEGEDEEEDDPRDGTYRPPVTPDDDLLA
jgi:hypothetical protein